MWQLDHKSRWNGMRYFLLLVVILCFSKPGEAQNPGYLGKHVMVGLDFSYTPSFTRKYRINTLVKESLVGTFCIIVLMLN